VTAHGGKWWLLLAAMFAVAAAGAAQSVIWEAAIEWRPVGVNLHGEGLPSPSFGVGGQSAFYVASSGKLLRLEASGPIEMEGDRQQLHAVLEDGREAVVSGEPGPRGTVRIAFSVSGKGEFEKLGVDLAVSTTEGFYGLMERVVQGSQGLSWQPGMTEGLNLRGQSIDLYTLPTLSIYAPFFLSSAGWGIYVEGDWPSAYRFGVDETGRPAPTCVAVETEGPELAILVIPGPRPIDVIQGYADLTGRALVPPRFLLGPGRWRDECWDLSTFYDGTVYRGRFNSMIVEDVLMMSALGIPCSWIVVDRPWASGSFGYGGMRVDDLRYPAFGEMVDWLEERGIDTLLWIGPWGMDEQRSAAVANGYDVPLTLPYRADAALIDFTNPDAVAWWADELRPLLETGIAGFKLDRGEEKPPDGQLFRGTYFDGTNYREGHNAYPLWFAEAAYAAGQTFGIEG
jgi:alpha-D-xyloside xylohydrolase